MLLSANETSIDWFMKGYNLYNQEKFSESLDAYNRALELDPRDFEAWNNRGIDLGLLGKYDEALTSFRMLWPSMSPMLRPGTIWAWFTISREITPLPSRHTRKQLRSIHPIRRPS